jgi:hypothetical protein
MVRETQVSPAAVNVNGCAQGFLDHCRAFNMPARPTPNSVMPTFRLTRLGWLPQDEVARITLAWIWLNSVMTFKFAVLRNVQSAGCSEHERRFHHQPHRHDPCAMSVWIICHISWTWLVANGVLVGCKTSRALHVSHVFVPASPVTCSMLTFAHCRSNDLVVNVSDSCECTEHSHHSDVAKV